MNFRRYFIFAILVLSLTGCSSSDPGSLLVSENQLPTPARVEDMPAYLYLQQHQNELNKPAGTDAPPVQFTVAPGELPTDIAPRLQKVGLIKNADQKVSNDIFKGVARDVAGFSRVHIFYGMVEQTGSVFMECEAGRLRAPLFADIIIRDPQDWRECAIGEAGVIQVLSVLPRSYPGHSLLTEDRGRLLGEDDCGCGRMGKTFEVLGRLPKAEVRGCSDTFAQPVPQGAAA